MGIVSVQDYLANGSVSMDINKAGPFLDFYKSNVNVKLYLGRAVTGTSVFKKCQVTGEPKTKKYKNPFSPYDFQALTVHKICHWKSMMKTYLFCPEFSPRQI